ncbi:hypothetical protein M8818_006298 [Zalaria obscura]|uniref:Uncharacterized protein n=1 Tax=Zalaria obscura TaxID=2024903 RepID=A0ACC3S7G3_9PEZI
MKLQKRKRAEAHQKKKEAETVRRSRILQAPLTSGISLDRELGYSRISTLKNARTSVLASRLIRTDLADCGSCESCGRPGIVYDFDYDPLTDGIVWGVGTNMAAQAAYLNDYAAHPSDDLSVGLAAFHSEISSVSITQSRTILITSLNSSHPGNVYATSFTHFNHLLPSADDVEEDFSNYTSPVYTTLGDAETSIYAAAPNPPGAQDITVLSTGESLSLLSPSATHLDSVDLPATTTALSWLDPNVVVAGSRNGAIYLWDVRTHGLARRFNHGGNVTALRATGTHQVLATGYPGMGLYDVRMTVEPWSASGNGVNTHNPNPNPNNRKNHQTPTNSHKPNHKHKAKSPHPSSRPLLWFPDQQSSLPNTVMDVHPASPSSLAAIRDDNNIVNVYNLSTAKRIARLETASYLRDVPRQHYQGDPPRASRRDRLWLRRLRWVERADGGVVLMACQGQRLLEWGWEGRGREGGGDGVEFDGYESEGDIVVASAKEPEPEPEAEARSRERGIGSGRGRRQGKGKGRR